MNTSFKRLLALLLSAMLLFSLAACGDEPATSSESESSIVEVDPYPFYNPLTEPDRIDDMAPAVLPAADMLTKITALSTQNSDARGWLTVPGTTIDDAVLQGPDNNRYLRANNLGKYAFEGCYFVDFRNTLKSRADLDYNTIIYGHNLGNPQNMKDDPNGDKFAQLLKYAELDFAKANPYLYVTTPTDTMVFKIFATFYSDVKFNYIETNFKTTDAFLALTNEAKARSEHIFDVEVGPSDRVLTLSTCTYKYGSGWVNHNQRFVVMGRLLRANEVDTDALSAVKNPTPKAPTF